MANPLLATIVRKGGGKLLDLAVGRFIEAKPGENSDTPAKKPKRTLTKTIAGAAVTRIATRSVPGAIVVAGGILAKTLYDRRRGRKGGQGKPDA